MTFDQWKESLYFRGNLSAADRQAIDAICLEITRLRSLNAELLAACEAIENAITFDKYWDAKDRMRKAIAKIKESKP